MDSTSSKLAGATVTPTKEKIAGHAGRSTSSQNRNPNLSTPRLKTGNVAVSRKANPKQLASPPSSSLKKKKNIPEKKLRMAGVGDPSRAAVVCEKCKTTPAKCFCVGYESSKASFKNAKETEDFSSFAGMGNGGENEENGESGLRKSRARLLEAARWSLPESGSGRVMHLVTAFENLLTISKSGDEREYCKNVMKWALPGLQQETRPEVSETSSFNPSDFALTPEKSGLDSGCSYSLECSQASLSARTSTGGRKSRRSILRGNESSGTVTKRNGKGQQTSQKPFFLRTEQRERSKGEKLTKKLQQTLEEEALLILPWTTDEPEVVENTNLIEQSQTAEASRRRRRRNQKAEEGGRPKGS